MRLWEKYLNQVFPDKAKLWAILGAIFDALLIGTIMLTLFWHSCEICYTTNSISGVYKSCTKTTEIFEHGNTNPLLKSPFNNITVNTLP